jgi:hypothetical protein
MIESQGSLPGMAKMYLIILILAAMIVGAAFLYGQSTAAAPEPSFPHRYLREYLCGYKRRRAAGLYPQSGGGY